MAVEDVVEFDNVEVEADLGLALVCIVGGKRSRSPASKSSSGAQSAARAVSVSSSSGGGSRRASASRDAMMRERRTVKDRATTPGHPMAGRRFIVSCMECKHVVMVVARIGSTELDRLREHLLACCPHKVIDPSPGVETTLRHFAVAPTDSEKPPPAA